MSGRSHGALPQPLLKRFKYSEPLLSRNNVEGTKAQGVLGLIYLIFLGREGLLILLFSL